MERCAGLAAPAPAARGEGGTRVSTQPCTVAPITAAVTAASPNSEVDDPESIRLFRYIGVAEQLNRRVQEILRQCASPPSLRSAGASDGSPSFVDFENGESQRVVISLVGSPEQHEGGESLNRLEVPSALDAKLESKKFGKRCYNVVTEPLPMRIVNEAVASAPWEMQDGARIVKGSLRHVMQLDWQAYYTGLIGELQRAAPGGTVAEVEQIAGGPVIVFRVGTRNEGLRCVGRTTVAVDGRPGGGDNASFPQLSLMGRPGDRPSLSDMIGEKESEMLLIAKAAEFVAEACTREPVVAREAWTKRVCIGAVIEMERRGSRRKIGWVSVEGRAGFRAVPGCLGVRKGGEFAGGNWKTFGPPGGREQACVPEMLLALVAGDAPTGHGEMGKEVGSGYRHYCGYALTLRAPSMECARVALLEDARKMRTYEQKMEEGVEWVKATFRQGQVPKETVITGYRWVLAKRLFLVGCRTVEEGLALTSEDGRGRGHGSRLNAVDYTKVCAIVGDCREMTMLAARTAQNCVRDIRQADTPSIVQDRVAGTIGGSGFAGSVPGTNSKSVSRKRWDFARGSHSYLLLVLWSSNPRVCNSFETEHRYGSIWGNPSDS